MDRTSIVFQFANEKAAYDAFDTLEELGYRPVFHSDSLKPMLHIHIENSDLTSALEIAQAHGGTFVDREEMEEQEAYTLAYELHPDEIQIPAHLVNEDLTDEYTKHDNNYL